MRSDYFIYSILNPSCANPVIEAISCGIPVVGFKAGSMEELLFFNKELPSDVSAEVFLGYKDADEHQLAEKILPAVRELPIFKQKAMEHSQFYPFKKTGAKYVQVFNQAFEKSSPRRFLFGLIH